MEAYQVVFVAAALSQPLLALAALCRGAVCVYRSSRARQVKFTIISSLGIVVLVVVFAGVMVVWFAYGVAHTGKNMSTDLFVLATTSTATYVAAFCLWRLSVFLEKRLA